MHGDDFYRIKPGKGQWQRSCVQKCAKFSFIRCCSESMMSINCGCAKGLNVRPGSDYFALSTSWGTWRPRNSAWNNKGTNASLFSIAKEHDKLLKCFYVCPRIDYFAFQLPELQGQLLNMPLHLGVFCSQCSSFKALYFQYQAFMENPLKSVCQQHDFLPTLRAISLPTRVSWFK